MLEWLRVWAAGAVCVGALWAQGQQDASAVCKWQGDKKAAFVLMFDDGWPSHVFVAVPEMHKRGLSGDFYIVPKKGEFLVFKKKWEEEAWKMGAVYGNHTASHKSILTQEQFEQEIAAAQEDIYRMVPGKNPRLISYARPGVPEWKISNEQEAEVIKKYNLISRPPFNGHGVVYHLQKLEQMLALADLAQSKGEWEYLVFHGVEIIDPNRGYQDFWAVKQDIFLPLLDELKRRSDAGDLWVTDHISVHKYETERASAQVKTQPGMGRMTVKLTSQADPKFYDLPLSVRTKVPAGWKMCTVQQEGIDVQKVAVANGTAVYQALPNGKPVYITRTN